MPVLSLHHVQLAMPRGREAEARSFYIDVLGFAERQKPPHLAVRGGVWFHAGSAEVHLGVEDDFRPAKKAHPALLVDDLEAIAQRCRSRDLPVTQDQPLEGYVRLYVADPFGNRVELLQAD